MAATTYLVHQAARHPLKSIPREGQYDRPRALINSQSRWLLYRLILHQRTPCTVDPAKHLETLPTDFCPRLLFLALITRSNILRVENAVDCLP